MKIKCPECDYNNLEKSRYCQNCGNDFSGNKLSLKGEVESLHEQIENIDDIIFKPKKKSNSLLNIFLIAIAFFGGLFVLMVIWYMIFPDEQTVKNESTQATDSITSTSPWKTFTSVEHNFKINFPTDWEAERIPEKTLDNGVTYSGMQYTSSPNKDEIYVAQASDYDISPENYDNKMGLEGIANGLAQGSNGKLTNTAFTKFKGYDAIEFTFSNNDNYFGKGIAFIKDDMKYIKMYLIMILNNSNEFKNYDLFKGSFEL